MYGSWPLEQAADQICSRSLRSPGGDQGGQHRRGEGGERVAVPEPRGLVGGQRLDDPPGAARRRAACAPSRRRSRRRAGRACGRSAAAGPRRGTPCPAPGRSRSPCAPAGATQSKPVAVSVIAEPPTAGARRSSGGDGRATRAEDGLGDAVQRQHLVGVAGLGDRAGHAPDHRGGLVLHQHGAAGGAHLAGPAAAVRAHAGEDDGQDGALVDRDGGAEQRVDRRAAEVLRRVLGQARSTGPRGVARTTRWRSPGARCTVPGSSGVPSRGLHARAAALSRSSRWANWRVKTRRHVLDEQDRHRQGRPAAGAARGPAPRDRRWRSRSRGRRAGRAAGRCGARHGRGATGAGAAARSAEGQRRARR